MKSDVRWLQVGAQDVSRSSNVLSEGGAGLADVSNKEANGPGGNHFLAVWQAVIMPVTMTGRTCPTHLSGHESHTEVWRSFRSAYHRGCVYPFHWRAPEQSIAIVIEGLTTPQ